MFIDNFFLFRSQIVGTAQIPLDAFQTALRFVGVTDVDMDELECIIANLIASVSAQSKN